MKLELDDCHLALFLACVGIGTLEAMRTGALAADAGIWSLGAPGFWKPFDGKPGALGEIAAVCSGCDELAAIQELMPERFDEKVQALIARLRRIVAEAGDPWRASWSD